MTGRLNVTLDGYDAIRLDVAPMDPTDPLALMFTRGYVNEGRRFVALATEWRARLWLLKVNGHTHVVVLAGPGDRFDPFLAEAMPIVRSLEFGVDVGA